LETKYSRFSIPRLEAKHSRNRNDAPSQIQSSAILKTWIHQGGLAEGFCCQNSTRISKISENLLNGNLTSTPREGVRQLCVNCKTLDARIPLLPAAFEATRPGLLWGGGLGPSPGTCDKVGGHVYTIYPQSLSQQSSGLEAPNP